VIIHCKWVSFLDNTNKVLDDLYVKMGLIDLKRLNDNGSLLNVVCSSIIYEILSAGHLDITIIGRVRDRESKGLRQTNHQQPQLN